MSTKVISIDQLNLLNSHFASALVALNADNTTTERSTANSADFQKHSSNFFTAAKQLEYSLEACQVLAVDPASRLKQEIASLESEIANVDALLAKYRRKAQEWEDMLKQISISQQKVLESE